MYSGSQVIEGLPEGVQWLTGNREGIPEGVEWLTGNRGFTRGGRVAHRKYCR